MNFKPEKSKSVKGELRILGQDDDLNYFVEIDLIRSGVNENDWDYRNVKQYASTFIGQPILTAYVGRKIGDGHNMDKRIDPMTGEEKYSFMGPTAERIVGTIGESPDAVRTEDRDGQTWVIARGKLWRFYHPELVDKIARQGRMAVSAETDIKTIRREGKVEIYEEWRGLGVTILGDGVAPAVPGANIHTLAELESTFREMKLRAASYQTDRSKGVKRSMTKTQMAAMQARFKDYSVLNVSDDGLRVLLRNKGNGAISGYVFSDKDDMSGIAPERVKELAMSANATFADSYVMDVDLSKLMDGMNADLVTSNAEIDTLRKGKAELEARIRDMEDKEDKRRTEQAKHAIENALEKINESRAEEDRINAEACVDLVQRAENGEFNKLENEKGEWIGDQRAETEVLARCMSKQMESDKRRMKANAAKKVFAWDLGGQDDGGCSGVDSAIRNITK